MTEVEADSATTRETLAYCVEMARPNGRRLVAGAVFLVIAVTITDVATPLVFASVLDRIATLQPGTAMWPRFGTLIVAYAILIVIGQAAFRMSGWLEWEGSLRTFANGIHRSFERLMRLGYRWHVDHPAGEVASSLSAFSWALMDGIDNLHWGVLRIIVVVISAVVVLAIVAWPVAVVLVVLTGVFAFVVVKRSAPVTEASRRFSRAHSRSRGHRLRRDPQRHHRAGGRRSGSRIGAGGGASLAPQCEPTCELGRVFTVTRVWMSGTVGLMTWGALLVGVVLAVRGDIRAGVIYLVLFYASQVSGQLIESFMQIRQPVTRLGPGFKAGRIGQHPTRSGRCPRCPRHRGN